MNATNATNTTNVRHFLTLNDLSKEEVYCLLDRASELRKRYHSNELSANGRRLQQDENLVACLRNRVLGMIFEKSSTRTRVSFEAAMAQSGGSAIFLSPRDTQLGRGEPVEDTARVLSSMVDIIMLRTYAHDKLRCFAQYSKVPVINALTDDYHPCQLLADLQTFIELRGDIQGKTVCWIGDGNNMCNSYINAANLLGFNLNICCPKDYMPNPIKLQQSKHIKCFEHSVDAVKGSHLVVTDVWASMGQEQEQDNRAKIFSPYQVNTALLDHAHSEVLFMHCLPAHRGEEVCDQVLDDPRSVVWHEAENRLHAQKALLEFLLK